MQQHRPFSLGLGLRLRAQEGQSVAANAATFFMVSFSALGRLRVWRKLRRCDTAVDD